MAKEKQPLKTGTGMTAGGGLMSLKDLATTLLCQVIATKENSAKENAMEMGLIPMKLGICTRAHGDQISKKAREESLWLRETYMRANG